MQSSLRHSKSLINAIIDHIPGLIGYWSNDLRSVFANKEYEKWFGKTQEQMRDIHLRDLLGDELFKSNEPHIRAALNGEVQEFERSIVLPGGEKREALAHYIPHREDEKIQGFFVLLIDITERKRLGKAMIDMEEVHKRSIGRELHDSLGQQIAAISYQATALENKLHAAGSLDNAKIASSISSQANNAVMQCKQIAQGLIPFEIESRGLIHALQSFAYGIESTYEIECNFSYTDDIAIEDANISLNLYRIVQEAVHNALHHGRAHSLDISLSTSTGALCLSICDDGCGISNAPQTQDPHKGMGLKLMEHRAEQLGATLELLPTPKGGLEVRVEMKAV